jgi:hypothetical protein
VSRERVRVELVKLLPCAAAARALAIAERTGILAQVLPELAGHDIRAAIARVGGAPTDAGVRMAALLLPVPPERVDVALRRLTYSNAERARVVALVAQAARLSGGERDDAELRSALGRVGRAAAADLGALTAAPVAARLRAIAQAGDPLVIGDLAIGGADVMRILAVPPGRAVGRALEFLLERVLSDPRLNTGETLERMLRDDFRA